MDCKQVGWAVQRLGAGRAKPGDSVSAHAGIESHAKLGTKLDEGQPIFTLFSEDASLLDEPFRMLEDTVRLDQTPPERQPLLREIVRQP
jgi:pyrimidine-nucleoside phosphorylase